MRVASPSSLPPLSPLPALALAWYLGVWHLDAFGRWLGDDPGLARNVAFGVALAGGLTTWLSGVARARLWGWALVPLFFLAGSAQPTPTRVELPRTLVDLEVEVSRAHAGAVDREPALEVRVLSGAPTGASSSAAIAAGARLRVRGIDVAPGTRLRLRCELAPAPRYDNPSPAPRLFPPRNEGSCRPVRPPQVIAAAPWPRPMIHRARRGLADALATSLSPRAAGVARALLLGESRAVDADAREALRDAGMAHLLAISGLHVGIVFLLLGAIARWTLRALDRWFRVDEASRWATIASLPPLVGFALLAGAGPSVLRATSMALLAGLAIALRRRPSPPAILAVAALGVALVDPSQARAPGLLLSLLATAALVTTPPTHGALRRALHSSLRATLATAPLALVLFQQLPPLGFLVDALIAPIAAAALVPLSLAHALLSLALPDSLAQLSGAALELGVELLVQVATRVGSFGRGALPPPTTTQAVLLAFGAALLLWGARSARGRALVLVGLTLTLALEEARVREVERPRGELRVSYLDVDQGDATLLDLPDGTLTLIDVGTTEAARHALLPLLRARRRASIDRVIITHAHPDHYGGLELLAAELPIREIWDSGQARFETPEGPLARTLAGLRRRGVRVRGPAELCGRAVVHPDPQANAEARGAPSTRHEHGPRGGEVSLRLLWPCPGFDAGLTPNDNSLVVRVDAPRASLLFTGDAEGLAERSMLALGLDLRADVLQVGHHGSRTSSTEPFLRAVAAREAVISCGRASRYGHPHPEVRARLERHGLAIHATPESGGRVVRWSLAP